MKAKNTQKSNILKEVNKTAWAIIKETKVSWGDAIKRAWKLIKKNILAVLAVASSYFEITFVKVSTGEMTTRTASNAKVKDNNLLFFSITDNGFRTAVIEQIISINPINNAKIDLVKTA